MVQMGQYHLMSAVVAQCVLVAVVVAEEYFLEAVEQEELVNLLPIQRVKEGVREVGEAHRSLAQLLLVGEVLIALAGILRALPLNNVLLEAEAEVGGHLVAMHIVAGRLGDLEEIL